MSTPRKPSEVAGSDDDQLIEPVMFRFDLGRRAFVQLMGAGLAVAAAPLPAPGQRRGPSPDPAARIRIGTDGTITVLTGKVEIGQGARAELTQAAAEELRVAPAAIHLVMADTGRVPDDGITAGSRTTPSTVPVVRQAAAMTREVLARLAARRWDVEPARVRIADATIRHPDDDRAATFGELAGSEDVAEALRAASEIEAPLTEVGAFRVLGTSFDRPNARDLVTGAHRYPSDVRRPGIWFGKVLRPPAFGARLVSVDLEPARRMDGVAAVRDGDFVGACAATSHLAEQALRAIEATADWASTPQPSGADLFETLRNGVDGGMPENPFAEALSDAHRSLRQSYQVAYVQHAPMEPRAAAAEWDDGALTVWTGTQNPFGVHRELTRAFRLPDDRIRVIVPDTGGGFGGKHTGECAIEAARLARAAERPVSLQWTREEEFTWAYFRPAAWIDIEAGLDEGGAISSWHFININGGRSGVSTPYRCGRERSRDVGTDAPLRQGSYRALGSTGSNFARECFMDELAEAAGADPLDFRLAHLEADGDAGRLRAVLEEAARRFRWAQQRANRREGVGVGLACGTEKGSFVAACVEVSIDPRRQGVDVRRVCQVFECGVIYNPDNLRAQVEGAIIMGLGPALREETRFSDGHIQNPRFSQYSVPRFKDVPELDIHLLPRPDLPAVGGGETPIIAVAPAIANAVFDATGQRVRAMPIRLPG